MLILLITSILQYTLEEADMEHNGNLFEEKLKGLQDQKTVKQAE